MQEHLLLMWGRDVLIQIWVAVQICKKNNPKKELQNLKNLNLRVLHSIVITASAKFASAKFMGGFNAIGVVTPSQKSKNSSGMRSSREKDGANGLVLCMKKV